MAKRGRPKKTVTKYTAKVVKEENKILSLIKNEQH